MNDLERLAEIVGIEPFYWDIFGNRRVTSEGTMRALISAMGLPVGSPDEIAQSLRREEEAPWRRLAPSCLVVDENTSIEVPVAIPASCDGATLSWTLREESGAAHSGEIPVGNLQETGTKTLDGRLHRRRKFMVPRNLPMGYHDLELSIVDKSAVGKTASAKGAAAKDDALASTTRLISTPDRCKTVEEVVTGGRTWGIGLQLYGLRSETDWGIGDFDDLGIFAEAAAKLGAGVVGLNPLHPLFPVDPRVCSPYSPTSRRFLNILYIDVEAVPEFGDCEEAQEYVKSEEFAKALNTVRESTIVDYPNVAAIKIEALEKIYSLFAKRLSADASNSRAVEFNRFVKTNGEALYKLAVFEALQAEFVAEDPDQFAWQTWPAPYRDPSSPEVAAFAKKNAERVQFYMWMQFEADRQLGLAAERGRRAGLRVGFYRDLAVAVNPSGAATWSDRLSLVQGVNVGSPPDAFNLMGQNWGLSPLSPLGLRKTGYVAFIDAMRDNMRHAAALRIDHVMALKHLFWLPENGEPGAYVQYPFHDLLRIVALESRRAGCIIIGEDLGTVPEGFRPVLSRAGILSYRVLYFERNGDGTFIRPGNYPERALATVSTHDLATFRGFWNDRDLEWRRRLELYPDDGARNRDKWDRGVDRWRLLQALSEEGLRPWNYPSDEGSQPWSRDLAEAVHRYLSRTPSQVAMLQIEDALSEEEQPNLPGTLDQHPNWRRRLPVNVETMATDEGIIALANSIRDGR